jgi:hypothetical protein
LCSLIQPNPAGPVHVEVECSPEGFNWHRLSPPISKTIRVEMTCHFSPVHLGFLRFKLRHSEEIAASAANQTRPIGLRRIEVMPRGLTSPGTAGGTSGFPRTPR